MTRKETDLLARLDTKVDAIQATLADMKKLDEKQTEDIQSVSKLTERHQTYFKLAGWIAGSTTVLTMLVKGVLAYFK